MTHGRSQTLQGGRHLLRADGHAQRWKSEGYLRKIFVIFQPKA